MQHWEHAFAAHDIAIGQVLLTHDDLGDRRRFLSARLTLRALLDHGVVPIINENDTVATEEIKFGDNDQLAALVCNLVSADALVILTDVEGVRDAERRAHPDRARHRSRGRAGRRRQHAAASARAAWRRKVGSARIVTRTGVPGGGRARPRARRAARVLAGADVGTLFVPGAATCCRAASTGSPTARSRRAGSSSTTAPRARCATAARACCPAGIVAVDGDFELGDTVSVVTARRAPNSRAVSSAYPADDLRKIQGLQSAGIEARLGYKSIDEAIHRDDLVILVTLEPRQRASPADSRRRRGGARGARGSSRRPPAEQRTRRARARSPTRSMPRAREILAANARDVAAGRAAGLAAGDARSAAARRRAARGARARGRARSPRRPSCSAGSSAPRRGPTASRSRACASRSA